MVIPSAVNSRNRVHFADWRDEPNKECLHSSLGFVPPAEFVTTWKMQHQERLSLMWPNNWGAGQVAH